MADFKYCGTDYSAHKLGVFEQLDLARKVAPLVALIAPAIPSLVRDVKKGEALEDAGAQAYVAFRPFLAVLSQIPSEEFKEMLSVALKAVERRGSDGKFHPVMSGKTFLFQDMDYVGIVYCFYKACEENLRPTMPLEDITKSVFGAVQSYLKA